MPTIAAAQFTIRDATDITASSTAPSNPVTNELWLDTSVTPNQLKRYNGTGWVIVNDPSTLSAAVEAAKAAAETAQTTASAVQESLDGLTIGARNLIQRTLEPSTEVGKRPMIQNLPETEAVFSASGTASVVQHGIKITNTAAVRTYIRFGSNNITTGTMLGMLPGETYTLSCDASFQLLSGTKNTSTYNVYGYLFYYEPDNGIYAQAPLEYGGLYLMGIYTPELKGTELFKRVEWTFTVPPETKGLYIQFICTRGTASNYAAGDYISLANLKLEKGQKATGWTPAPEDVSDALAMAQSTADEAIATAQSVKNEIIVGTQTAATASWTGVASFSSLYDGQEITYWLPQTSASNATLNLTLSDGSKTGAIPLYYGGTTRLAKHYGAGNVIHLTYRENVTIDTTTIAKGWWADANYDTNTNTYDRIRLNNAIYCKAEIGASRLIVSDADGYDALKVSVAFDVTKPVLWLATATTAAGTSANGYLSFPGCTLRNNLAGFTGTKDKTCYLRGTLDGNIFTPSASMFTTDVPVDEDGLTYMALGIMYSTYQIYLYPEHPMYMLVDGVFKSLNQIAYDAQMTANDAQVSSSENAANIATLDSKISMTVSKTDYDADQTAIEQRITQVEQTASDFKVEVTRSIATQVASVASDVDAVTHELSSFQDTVTGYMDFNGDSLSIGVNGSNFKTEITNTEMAFTESGEKVAYISNSDMYITRARVTDTLSVGTVENGYFDFVTMAGGLALKWRSGSAG